MSAQRGSDMLLKMKDDTGNYVTIAGLRTKSLRLNSRPVDVTDTASAGGWKELLPGAGIRSAEISGSGVFRDAQSDALARQSFFDQSAQDYQFLIPGFGQISGSFILNGLTYGGTYQGEATFELTLMSAGAPEFSVL